MSRHYKTPKVVAYSGRDLASLARDYTEAALHKLVSLMTAKTSPENVQAQCAQYILDRGWGRVPSAPTDSATGPITVEIVYRQRDTTEHPVIDVTPNGNASRALPTTDDNHN
jgi:hypothetical protein